MRILGIDTATHHASIGLCEGNRILAEHTLKNRGSHAVSLLALIERVLADGGVAIDEVEAIAVSNGPGSFTGLRVGVSIAKGLACATGARLVGVSTLAALAHTVFRNGLICPLLDARRGDVYTASFERNPGGIRRLSNDRVISHEALTAILPTPCVIIGDAETAYGESLRSHFGRSIEFLPFEEFGPRGSTVAALGGEDLRRGAGDDPTHLEPLYIRASEAEASRLGN